MGNYSFPTPSLSLVPNTIPAKENDLKCPINYMPVPELLECQKKSITVKKNNYSFASESVKKGYIEDTLV